MLEVIPGKDIERACEERIGQGIDPLGRAAWLAPLPPSEALGHTWGHELILVRKGEFFELHEPDDSIGQYLFGLGVSNGALGFARKPPQPVATGIKPTHEEGEARRVSRGEELLKFFEESGCRASVLLSFSLFVLLYNLWFGESEHP